LQKIFKPALLLLAILLGSYHLWLTVKAVFVFRNDEPVSLWVFTFTGPLSTLPASITGAFLPKIGGTWLVCGAVLSFVAAMVTAGPQWDLAAATWFLTKYSGPMLVVGGGFWILSRHQKT
jgi:hypothetical protein